MQSSKTTSIPFFPPKVWVSISKHPQCSNPNCCSGQGVGVNNSKTRGRSAQRACNGDVHNAHCCHASGNKTCSTDDWCILYTQVEPRLEDIVRRTWMARWLSGQCALADAVKGFHDEWGYNEDEELKEAA